MRDEIYADRCEPIPRVTLRAAEAAKSLGISERALWDLTKTGDIPHFPYGRITLYPVKSLFEWAEGKTRRGEERPGGGSEDASEAK
jgi:hypothetical protein